MNDTKKVDMLYQHLLENDTVFYAKTLVEEIKEEFQLLSCDAHDRRVHLRIDENVMANLYCAPNHGVRIDITRDGRESNIDSSRSTALDDLKKALL